MFVHTVSWTVVVVSKLQSKRRPEFNTNIATRSYVSSLLQVEFNDTLCK